MTQPQCCLILKNSILNIPFELDTRFRHITFINFGFQSKFWLLYLLNIQNILENGQLHIQYYFFTVCFKNNL